MGEFQNKSSEERSVECIPAASTFFFFFEIRVSTSFTVSSVP